MKAFNNVIFLNLNYTRKRGGYEEEKQEKLKWEAASQKKIFDSVRGDYEKRIELIILTVIYWIALAVVLVSNFSIFLCTNYLIRLIIAGRRRLFPYKIVFIKSQLTENQIERLHEQAS